MAITNGYGFSNIRIEVTKGNGLADLTTEEFLGASFQFTNDVLDTGKADGMDVNKAIRVKKQVAVLGSRGDYVKIIADTTIRATTTWAMLVDGLYVEGLDFTGVPTAVQHTVFGEFSPFVTPKSSLQESMMDGIDRQEVMFSHNVACTHASDYKDQKLRGVSDDRITAQALGATAAVSKLTLKLKPNSDGVFVIPSGAIMWAGYGTPT